MACRDDYKIKSHPSANKRKETRHCDSDVLRTGGPSRHPHLHRPSAWSSPSLLRYLRAPRWGEAGVYKDPDRVFLMTSTVSSHKRIGKDY